MSRDGDSKMFFDLDDVLENEIKFGRFQIVIFFLIAFPIFLNGISSSSYIFTAGTVNYRYRFLDFKLLQVVTFNQTSPDVEFRNARAKVDQASHLSGSTSAPISRKNARGSYHLVIRCTARLSHSIRQPLFRATNTSTTIRKRRFRIRFANR